ncbi:MAG: hypothetical protein WAW27_08365 [Chitinophagaceae bacterium]
MKKYLLVSFSLVLISMNVVAQLVAAKPVKKVATLSMPTESGNNGATVVWHPVLKKYYASYAGNAEYPMAVFDATYRLVSPEDIATMFDVRGMWYNTITKRLEANGFDENGWISYKLDTKGIPEDIVQLQDGMVQPDKQSLGVFDAMKKKICFLSDNRILYYSLNGEALDEMVELKLKIAGDETMDDELEEDIELSDVYNLTALCYTGIPNAEFAILNYSLLQIEMYNRKGVLTKTLQLPDDTVVYNNFNFAYANSTWWLFDKNEKKWIGFK